MKGNSSTLRELIKQLLAAPGSVISGPEIARATGTPLSRVSYALLCLEQLGTIEVAERRRDGQSIETFYRQKSSQPPEGAAVSPPRD